MRRIIIPEVTWFDASGARPLEQAGSTGTRMPLVRAWWLAVIVVAGTQPVAWEQAAPPLAACAEGRTSGPDADLYCIELLPAGEIDAAAGTARLIPPSSPFGIAVTSAGAPQHDLVL